MSSAAHSSAAKASTTNRSKVTNSPQFVAGADNRSPWARRRRDLVDAFVAALGGIEKLSEVHLTDVRRAAELTVIAEQARAKALTEGAAAFDLTGIVRAEGAASRAVRALGLKSSKQASPLARLLQGAAAS